MLAQRRVAQISIHAPREGSDSTNVGDAGSQSAFQSTLPVRGATFPLFTAGLGFVFQSTLPVRGATVLLYLHHAIIRISIHAPREGSDSKTVQKTDACFVINGNFAKLNSQGSTWLAC